VAVRVVLRSPPPPNRHPPPCATGRGAAPAGAPTGAAPAHPWSVGPRGGGGDPGAARTPTGDAACRVAARHGRPPRAAACGRHCAATARVGRARRRRRRRGAPTHRPPRGRRLSCATGGWRSPSRRRAPVVEVRVRRGPIGSVLPRGAPRPPPFSGREGAAAGVGGGAYARRGRTPTGGGHHGRGARVGDRRGRTVGVGSGAAAASRGGTCRQGPRRHKDTGGRAQRRAGRRMAVRWGVLLRLGRGVEAGGRSGKGAGGAVRRGAPYGGSDGVPSLWSCGPLNVGGGGGSG